MPQLCDQALPKTRLLYWLVLTLIAIIALGLPHASYAQVAEDNVLDGILNTYRGAVGAWGPILRTFALRLFAILAFIEFAWTAITMALNQADIKQFGDSTFKC